MTDATSGFSTGLDSSSTTSSPAASNSSSNSVAGETSHPQPESFTKLIFGELECYIDQANRRAAPVPQVPIFRGTATMNNGTEKHFRLNADLMNIQTEIAEHMLFLNTANAQLPRLYARPRGQHTRISAVHACLTMWHEEMMEMHWRQLRIHNDLMENHTKLAENHASIGVAQENAKRRRNAQKKARRKERKRESAAKADSETGHQLSQRQATLSMNPSESEESNGGPLGTSSGRGETMGNAPAAAPRAETPVEILEDLTQSLTMSLD